MFNAFRLLIKHRRSRTHPHTHAPLPIKTHTPIHIYIHKPQAAHSLPRVQLPKVVVDLVLQNLGREEEHLRGGPLVGEQRIRHLLCVSAGCVGLGFRFCVCGVCVWGGWVWGVGIGWMVGLFVLTDTHAPPSNRMSTHNPLPRNKHTHPPRLRAVLHPLQPALRGLELLAVVVAPVKHPQGVARLWRRSSRSVSQLVSRVGGSGWE